MQFYEVLSMMQEKAFCCKVRFSASLMTPRKNECFLRVSLGCGGNTRPPPADTRGALGTIGGKRAFLVGGSNDAEKGRLLQSGLLCIMDGTP
jgi:hypothetical protein